MQNYVNIIWIIIIISWLFQTIKKEQSKLSRNLNLCFNDAILHFIHLIKIYDPKVLKLQKIQDRKQSFQLAIDTVDYIIFESVLQQEVMVIAIVFCLMVMELQWIKFQLEQVVQH